MFESIEKHPNLLFVLKNESFLLTLFSFYHAVTLLTFV